MKAIVNLLLFFLGFFVIVFPNSFQLTTALLLVLTNAFIFFCYGKIIVARYFIYAWIILSLLFTVFTVISGIDLAFKFELLLKYVFFPLLWLNIATYIKLNFDIAKFTKILFNYSVIGLISVIVLYTLMLNGYNYVEYFFINPNINNEYFLGFTLHVYGSLVFFATGLFILPNIYSNKVVVFLYMILLIVVVIISGRTALIVSLFIGLLILFMRHMYNFKFGALFSYLLSFVIIIAVFAYYTQTNLNYNFFEYLQGDSWRKLRELGGEERTSQSALMVKQILENPWGIGFSSIGIERNADRSFKYEVLILATILRFGVFGFALIVSSLFPLFMNLRYFSRWSTYRKFFFAGFCSIILFSFTNPYLEAFSFQWMFFCPLVFLCDFKDENLMEDKSSDNEVIQLPS